MFSLQDIHSEEALELAINAAVAAGNSILKLYGKKLSVNTKSDDSPVTEADLQSNKILKKFLSNTHMILSEEDADDKRRFEEEFVWIVDPLDGTLDFINKTGEFTVMVALVQNKKPILGVINWPVGGVIFTAWHKKGAFKYSGTNWERISVTNRTELTECRAVGSRHHLSEIEKKLIKQLGIKQFASVGSSLKAGRISSGEAEAYIATTNKMKEWDSAASYCIINEAGGKMTDMLGNDLSYNNESVSHYNGILATNGLIHDKIVQEFQKLQ